MTSDDQNGSNIGVQKNKRKNLRSPILTLRVKFDDGQKAFFGYAQNISASGMFIASVNPKEPGESYDVEIPLPAPINRTVQCNCEVIWKRQYEKKCPYEPGMGLRFVDLPAEVAADIERWVAQASK